MNESVDKETATEVIHTGELGYAYHDPKNPFIIRNYNWTVAVRCHVQRFGSVQANVTRNDTGVGHQGDINSTTQYPIVTEFYSDPNYRQVNSCLYRYLNFKVGLSITIKITY